MDQSLTDDNFEKWTSGERGGCFGRTGRPIFLVYTIISIIRNFLKNMKKSRVWGETKVVKFFVLPRA